MVSSTFGIGDAEATVVTLYGARVLTACRLMLVSAEAECWVLQGYNNSKLRISAVFMPAFDSTVIDASTLSDHFTGIRIIGDVHGTLDELEPIIDAALEKQEFIIFLGDIVNRGPCSVGCMSTVLKVVEREGGILIPGNHEQKLQLLLNGPSSFSNSCDMNSAWLSELRNEIYADRKSEEIARRFIDLACRSRLWRRIGQAMFAHAAIPRWIIKQDAPKFGEVRRGENSEIDAVIWGERERMGPITYRWIDELEDGMIAIIGHHPRSRSHPVKMYGAGGGIVVFLDTGAGLVKGQRLGRLSSINFEIGSLSWPSQATCIQMLSEVPSSAISSDARS